MKYGKIIYKPNFHRLRFKLFIFQSANSGKNSRGPQPVFVSMDGWDQVPRDDDSQVFQEFFPIIFRGQNLKGFRTPIWVSG